MAKDYKVALGVIEFIASQRCLWVFLALWTVGVSAYSNGALSPSRLRRLDSHSGNLPFHGRGGRRMHAIERSDCWATAANPSIPSSPSNRGLNVRVACKKVLDRLNVVDSGSRRLNNLGKRCKKLKRLLIVAVLPFILALRRVSPSYAAGRSSAVVTQRYQDQHTKLAEQGHRNRRRRSKAKVVIEVNDDKKSVRGAVSRSSLGDRAKRNMDEIKSALEDTEIEVTQTWKKLLRSLEGTKLDTLILLVATSVVIPLFKSLKKSSILGFLLTGTLLGPNGLNWLNDVHRIDMLGELGVVFFLFEMGLDLSLERLRAMRKDVFGLGTTTFAGTTFVGTVLAQLCGLPLAPAIAISSSLSLSSSAFVLQLLKDKDAMNARYGRAAFGILLLQDLAVVPVLVVIELLSGPSAAIGRALSVAAVKAAITLSTMSILGRKILDPLFNFVARSNSEEAFISIILSTVLLMSFVTQGIGLSNTLGAFLAGLLLAETRYRYQVEADIAPYRGVLLGFFFITVGFSIDLKLLIKEAPKIFAILAAMVASKASVITASSMIFGLKPGPAVQTGLLNSQGGEFAFVAFAVAERSGLIPSDLKKILLTAVALSMAATPALAGFGEYLVHRLESHNTDLPPSTAASITPSRSPVASPVSTPAPPSEATSTKPRGEAPHVNIKESGGFVLVLGYGRVGKMVCDMLEHKHIKYIAIDNSPKRTIEARNKGLPIYFGDVNRPEVLKYFKANKATTCVVTVDDVQATNRAIITLRKNYKNLPIIVRAENQQHKGRIESLYPGIHAMCPMLPEDSLILTLPFGGAVLESLGVNHAEVDSIVDEFGKDYMDHEGVKDFFTRFQRRMPPSAVPSKNEILDSFENSPLEVTEEDEMEEAVISVVGNDGD